MLKLDSSITEKEWQEFWNKHAAHAFFHEFRWGMVEEACGNKVVRWGVRDNKRLVAIIQGIVITAKRGKYLHVRHGPIVENRSSSLWKRVMALLIAETKILQLHFIRISPLLPLEVNLKELTGLRGIVSAPIHAMDAEYCQVLTLPTDAQQLLPGFRKSTRYDIRKALEQGVEVVSTTDEERLTEFFGLYDATSKRQGFVKHHGVMEEFSIFARELRAKLYLGLLDKKVYAGAIIVYSGKQAIYRHGASISSPIAVASTIQYQAMQDAIKEGLVEYNMWGIAPPDKPNHPWIGLTRFKQGFGGELKHYVHAHDIILSPIYALNWGVETVRRIRKGY